MRRLLRGGSASAGDDSIFESEKPAARTAPNRFRKSRGVWSLQASVQVKAGLSGSAHRSGCVAANRRPVLQATTLVVPASEMAETGPTIHVYASNLGTEHLGYKKHLNKTAQAGFLSRSVDQGDHRAISTNLNKSISSFAENHGKGYQHVNPRQPQQHSVSQKSMSKTAKMNSFGGGHYAHSSEPTAMDSLQTGGDGCTPRNFPQQLPGPQDTHPRTSALAQRAAASKNQRFQRMQGLEFESSQVKESRGKTLQSRSDFERDRRK